MADDFSKLADEFFNSPTGAKFSGKKDEINSLINTPDGQKIKQMVESGDADLFGAIQNGDVNALKNTLSEILKTQEGARLARQLRKMMK